MFQKFILKKMIGSKLKAMGISDEQLDQLVDTITKNPAILEAFKKIEKQVETLKKQGIGEQAAMMTVMRTHGSELQKLFGGLGMSK